jgi:alpha-1,2-mannosyltransferase
VLRAERQLAERRTLRAAAGVLIAAAAVWVFVVKAAGRMPDFQVYWTAGSRAARAEPLYRTADEAYQFKYFPAFAVMAIPLAAIPLPVAKAFWFGASVGALLLLLRLIVFVPPESRRPAWWLVLVSLVALGKYYAEDLVLGQINIVLTLVATGAIVALASGREALAGGLVALAVVIKPYALILVPWLVARWRARSIMTAAIGLAAAVVLPSAIYGMEGAIALHRDWWRTVSDTTAGTLTHSDNVSLAAMYTKWLGTGAAAGWAAATGAALLLAAALVIRARHRVPHPDGLEAALLLTLTPLLSPQAWDYVVIVSTPAIVYLANYHDRLPRSLRPLSVAAVAVIGLTLFDLLGRRLHYALMDLSVITLGFLVVIVSLCALRMRKVA